MLRGLTAPYTRPRPPLVAATLRLIALVLKAEEKKMKLATPNRLLAAAGASALTAGLMLVPAVAQAFTPVSEAQLPASAVLATTTESIAACEISDATLNWGILERWRAYIQGSIAKGSWSESGNVAYELPEFVWSAGTGLVAETGEAGTVNFEGEVAFSGHDNLLQVNLANPTLEIVDAEEAYLLLDLSSTKQDGEPDIAVTQERAIKLDIQGTAKADGNTLTFTTVPGQLTAEGAAAFGGFYSAGELVDPVTIQLTAADSNCVFSVDESAPRPPAEPAEDDAPVEDEATTTDTAEPETSADFPWLPVTIGGIALLVIVGAVIMLVTGRKKGDGAEADLGPAADDTAGASAGTPAVADDDPRE